MIVAVSEARDVSLNSCGIAADRGDCLVELGLAPTYNKYAGAFLRKAFGNAEANAGAAAGDNSDFVWKLAGHADFPSD